MRNDKGNHTDQAALARLRELLALAAHQVRRTHALLDGIERCLADVNPDSQEDQEAGWRIAA